MTARTEPFIPGESPPLGMTEIRFFVAGIPLVVGAMEGQFEKGSKVREGCG